MHLFDIGGFLSIYKDEGRSFKKIKVKSYGKRIHFVNDRLKLKQFQALKTMMFNSPNNDVKLAQPKQQQHVVNDLNILHGATMNPAMFRKAP